jgi:hypothetical protein
LEEVGVADRAGFDDSREDDEELENNATSKNDEGDQAEDGTLKMLLVRYEVENLRELAYD